jgi:hypothetical protein
MLCRRGDADRSHFHYRENGRKLEGEFAAGNDEWIMVKVGIPDAESLEKL